MLEAVLLLRCSWAEAMCGGVRKQNIESMGRERLRFVQIIGSQWQKKKYKPEPSCWQFSGKSFETVLPSCNLDVGPCELKPAELCGHIFHTSNTAVPFAEQWTVITWFWIWMGCCKVARSQENKTSTCNQGQYVWPNLTFINILWKFLSWFTAIWKLHFLFIRWNYQKETTSDKYITWNADECISGIQGAFQSAVKNIPLWGILQERLQNSSTVSYQKDN